MAIVCRLTSHYIFYGEDQLYFVCRRAGAETFTNLSRGYIVRLFFGWGQIILNIAFFGFRSTAFHSVVEYWLWDVVRLCSTSDRQSTCCTECFNNKGDSAFLCLYGYIVVVEKSRVEVKEVATRSESARDVYMCETYMNHISLYKFVYILFFINVFNS